MLPENPWIPIQRITHATNVHMIRGAKHKFVSGGGGHLGRNVRRQILEVCAVVPSLTDRNATVPSSLYGGPKICSMRDNTQNMFKEQ